MFFSFPCKIQIGFERKNQHLFDRSTFIRCRSTLICCFFSPPSLASRILSVNKRSFSRIKKNKDQIKFLSDLIMSFDLTQEKSLRCCYSS